MRRLISSFLLSAQFLQISLIQIIQHFVIAFSISKPLLVEVYKLRPKIQAAFSCRIAQAGCLPYLRSKLKASTSEGIINKVYNTLINFLSPASSNKPYTNRSAFYHILFCP
jgi:hypothetical protein